MKGKLSDHPALTIVFAICGSLCAICLLILFLGKVYLDNRPEKKNYQMENSSTISSDDTSQAEDESGFEEDETDEIPTSEESPNMPETTQPTEIQVTQPSTLPKETISVKAEVSLDTPQQVTENHSSSELSSGNNGTTSANLFNGGFIATNGGRNYFRGDDGYLYASEIDSNYAECILKKKIWYINAQGGWIYFSNETDGCLARIRMDGTDYQVLLNEPVHEVNVSENYIYYCTDTSLRRMKNNGTEDTKLVSGKIWYLNVSNDALYFCLIEGARAMCKCDFDGNYINRLISSDVYDILVTDTQIYYTYGKEERHLYVMDKRTHGTEQLNSNYTHWINADNRYIYYTNYEAYTSTGVGYGNTIYRITFDGSVNEMVYSDEVEGICLQNNRLYYMNPNAVSHVIKLD